MQMNNNFFDTSVHIRAIHCFVLLLDDVILFEKNKESGQDLQCFKGKSTQRSFLQLKCLSNILSIHSSGEISPTTVSYISKIRYTYLSIYFCSILQTAKHVNFV